MPISLEAFRKICNGSENVGEIRLNNKGTGLEKINNHVYKTSLNNVRLTIDENRKVRNALLQALGRHVDDFAAFDKLKDELLGQGRDEYALSRDYVRHLISAVTKAPKNQILDRVTAMNGIGTQLLNRTITARDNRVQGERLVKSRKAEAFSQTINEKSDDYIRLARKAIAKLDSISDPAFINGLGTSNAGNITQSGLQMAESAIKVIPSVCDVIASDTRLSENVRAAIEKDLSGMCSNLRENTNFLHLIMTGGNCGDKLYAYLEREIRLTCTKAGADEQIVDDNLGRLFGNPYHKHFYAGFMCGHNEKKGEEMKTDAEERVAGLKQLFFRVGKGLVNDLKDIRDIRENFLNLLKDEISNTGYTIGKSYNSGFVLPKDELYKKAKDLANAREKPDISKSNKNQFEKNIRTFDWTNGAEGAKKLESLLKADFDSLFEAYETNEDVREFKAAIWKNLCRIGLGV